jgi:signal transduction histidine kinase/ActR/RegA family two-component response regulator
MDMTYPILALLLFAGLLVAGVAWWRARQGLQQAVRALAEEQGRVQALIQNEVRLREAGTQLERQSAALQATLDEAQQARQALRLRDEQFNTLSRHLPGLLIEVRSGADGALSLHFASTAAQDVLGFAPEQLARDLRPALALVEPEDAAGLGGQLTEAARRGRAIALELRYRHPRKGLVWIHGAASPLRRADGSVAWIGYCEDVTESRSAQQALRQDKDAAEAASRAKSAFLADMGQQIRTPMNGMLGLVELLAGLPTNPEQKNYLASLRGSARSLLTLLDDMLDLAMIESGRLELEQRVFDPRALAQGCLDQLSGAAAHKGLTLDLRCSPGVPAALSGDAKRVQKLLAVLLGRAVEVSGGGPVTLSLTPELALGPGGLRACVSDTGQSLDRATLEQLFKPFMSGGGSAAAAPGASGLGLATVGLVAQAMGGAASATSEAGRGSRLCFTARFEMSAPTQQETAPAASMYVPLSSQRVPGVAQWRILLVEDNPTNQFYTQAVLRKLGHKVDTAGNGRDGIAHATSAVRYDLILMDCEMPELDGFEATRRIRAHESQAGAARRPIIALCVGAADDARKACLDCGMDEVLAKPFTVNDMRGLLARAAQGAFGAL